MKKLNPSISIRDMERRDALLLRVERFTELPLLILSFIMIPLLVGPFLWDLSSGEEAVFFALDTLIWAIFAIDILGKTAIAPHRMSYLKRHRLEVLVVAIPFLRPLRILRILIFGSRAFREARRLANIDFLLVYGIGLIITSATVVLSVEHGKDGAIQTFPDALWYSVVTITTVGYGDMVPVTIAGRAMGYLLMFGGIAFFSAVTANLASFFVQGKESSDQIIIDQLVEEVRQLRQELTVCNINDKADIYEDER